MKVLQVVPSLAPEWGGPVKVVNELAGALEAIGVSSEIISAQGRRVGNPETVTNDIPIHLFETGPIARLWTAHTPGLKKTLARKIPDFDLVHIQELWHYPGYIASKIARSRNVPYIVTIHGELNEWNLQQKRLKKQIYMTAVQRGILQKSAALHAITQAESNRIRQLEIETPVAMIPNGTHTEEFENLPDRSQFVSRYPELENRLIVLFLGRIQQKKGLDILAQAFGNLARTRDDVRLVVAGPDEDNTLTEVKTILKSHGALEKAVFPGMLTGEQKLEALSAADIFTLTSYSEGFSVALLEALSAGLPLVITNECNFPEVGDSRAGFVVRPNDSETASALMSLLDSADLRREMSQNARRLVRSNYTWERIAEKMFTLYGNVIAGNFRAITQTA
ncbi:MAG TPA: glycosyltransferase [Dehalococcoidia bacterium]|nr:glycosyltransferase [Dehalococcoidia bacterium]